jgi:hypothetical protein
MGARGRSGSAAYLTSAEPVWPATGEAREPVTGSADKWCSPAGRGAAGNLPVALSEDPVDLRNERVDVEGGADLSITMIGLGVEMSRTISRRNSALAVHESTK